MLTPEHPWVCQGCPGDTCLMSHLIETSTWFSLLISAVEAQGRELRALMIPPPHKILMTPSHETPPFQASHFCFRIEISSKTSVTVSSFAACQKYEGGKRFCRVTLHNWSAPFYPLSDFGHFLARGLIGFGSGCSQFLPV